MQTAPTVTWRFGGLIVYEPPGTSAMPAGHTDGGAAGVTEAEALAVAVAAGGASTAVGVLAEGGASGGFGAVGAAGSEVPEEPEHAATSAVEAVSARIRGSRPRRVRGIIGA